MTDQPRADAIPTAPLRAALDVERLGHAVHRSAALNMDHTGWPCRACIQDADDIAREYAALAPADPTADLLRGRLDAALGRLDESDLWYDHERSNTAGEPMDPELYVRYEALRAALAASTTEDET